jgi:glycosyltransferase involved in cell wall biosynthesis
MSRDTSKPLVSIAIPFHDSYADYLADCLRSVLAQTYACWEAIVVDDASMRDDARTIVAGFGDSRIRVIRHERNRGQAAGRNTAIRATTGALIMSLDCDDVLAPTHLEKLVRALDAHPDCGAAYADYRLFHAASGDLEFPLRDIRALLKEQWIPHPGTIVRRVLWEQANGYCEDEAFRAGNEDWDYFLSVAEVGLKAVRVPEPLYYYRQHEKSITSRRFACADHAMRELMYLRHRPLFDRFGMGRPFLAGGYRTSGKAYWRQGERRRAMTLLTRAAWLSPLDFIQDAFRAFRRRQSSHHVASAH